MGNAVWQALRFTILRTFCVVFPHIFVWGSCFWFCTSACLRLRLRLSATHLRHTCSHTTCSHTHTTYSHTTCPPTSCSPHNLSPHNLSTHNLLTHNLLTHNLLTTQLVTTQLVHTRLNVGLWLVARFAIVAILSKLFWNPCIVWRVHFCGKKWDSFFQKKTTCNCWEEDFFSKKNCQIQTPSLSQRSKSLIKPLLKNSFSTIFQGPGPGEAPFHLSRFVFWVHYCSKLCQSSSWKPKREASLFQKQFSNPKPFPKGPIPY